MGRADDTEKPELTEPQIIDCVFLTGAEASVDADGMTIRTVGWVHCPSVHEHRVTMRVAASRAVAEDYCRKLMAVLGIKEGGRH